MNANSFSIQMSNWYPLSRGQAALWFLWKLAPQSWAYNMVLPVGVRGELDVTALHRSLQKLSDRHPCLRTEFREVGGKAQQRAREGHQLGLDQVEASGWSGARLSAALGERAYRPFDLGAGATPRVTLFRRGRGRHVLLFVVHHIVCDLWSLIVLMDELREVYAAEKAAKEWSLPPLSASYEDYVHAERRLLKSGAGNRHWDYWRQELATEPPALDLPTDRRRPPIQSFRGGTVIRRLDAELTRELKRLAGEERVTLYMALLAAYQVLLHRYTAQEDIVVGSPTSGRNRAELAGLVGDLVNMVPLRADLAGDPTFRDCLVQARSKVVGAIRHQDYPFSLLVDRLQTSRDPSRSPIFQTSFVLQTFHRFPELSRMMLPAEDEATIPFGDLALEPLPLAQQDGQFDVNLEMKEDETGRLVGAWKYSADLFEAETVGRMAGHFETLLRDLVAHPERPVSQLRLLSAGESREGVAGGQGAPVELPAGATVCELFELQVERRGSEVAVSCGEDSLTYAELGRRVTGLARCLVELGVGAEVLVTLLLPRGLDFVTLLLAVSKAGGAFLPLDPRHPRSRTRRILETSRSPLVLTVGALEQDAGGAVAGLPEAARPRVVTLEALASEQASASLPPGEGGALAYVMVTSGSTGSPKGVMVEHRGMVNHVLAKLSDLGMDEDDVLAQNGPPTFDIVVWQCLAPLVLGGRVAVLPDEVAEDPAELVAEVERRGVTVLQLVPSMFQAVVKELSAREGGAPALSKLRWMVPTGEALPTELCQRWLELYPGIPVLNTYGSTECSDDQCHYALNRLDPADAAVAVVSIGTPIQNLTAHVLDTGPAPVPAGVVGELYVGGLGVGRGYRDDPVRTAAAFIPDPLGERPGARLYRTRDSVRRRTDGNLDFLGRVDHMIKLHGFRIEPGEIEAALCRHPAISGAAVRACDHPAGELRLVGYVVASTRPGDPPLGAEDLRRFLAAALPLYLVPADYCFLDALPLTANGKLDLRRLPVPEWEPLAAVEFVAPSTPAEEEIAAIWIDVLGLERVGVTEDFFAIGGDSIRSIQIVARCKRAGLDLRPSDPFLHPTISRLAVMAQSRARAVSGGREPREGAPLPDPLVSEEHLEVALAQVEFDYD